VIERLVLPGTIKSQSQVPRWLSAPRSRRIMQCWAGCGNAEALAQVAPPRSTASQLALGKPHQGIPTININSIEVLSG
jgi:hypothetical protein